jgi:hypothetical protein
MEQKTLPRVSGVFTFSSMAFMLGPATLDSTPDEYSGSASRHHANEHNKHGEHDEYNEHSEHNEHNEQTRPKVGNTLAAEGGDVGPQAHD